MLKLNCLKFYHIVHDTTAYIPASTLYTLQNNDILGSRLIACCKLAQTLAGQMWRHNYVIGRNEYLISTLSESTITWVYSLQFLFKSTNNSWRYERKCEWVFFSEHSVYSAYQPVYRQSRVLRSYTSDLYCQHSLHRSSVLMLRPTVWKSFLICTHCRQLHFHYISFRSFARYKFVTYLLN